MKAEEFAASDRPAMPPLIRIADQPGTNERQTILSGLAAYNLGRAGPAGGAPLAIMLFDEDGNDVGGLWGSTLYGWLQIELLFVPAQ